MKKVLLVILGLAVVSPNIWAQVKAHVGASSTVHTTLILDQGLRTDKEYVAVNSIQFAPVGLSFGLEFNNKFGLQLESIYAQYQQAYTIYNEVSQNREKLGELDFYLEYINIPMLMRFTGGSDGRARASFMLGPQLSILQNGYETLSLNQNASSQILAIPDVPDGTSPGDVGDQGLPSGTIALGDGTYQLPSNIPTDFQTDLIAKNAEEQVRQWREQELHIVAGFGVDFDLTKNIYISAIGKVDYGLTDMRNGDLIDQLKNATLQNVQDLYARRSNVAIGVQFSVNYMFGGTRYFLKALR